MPQFGASLKIVIYNHNIFIIQAIGVYDNAKFATFLFLPPFCIQ